MVGILLSFWNGLFSGAMLVSRRVCDERNHLERKMVRHQLLEASMQIPKNLDDSAAEIYETNMNLHRYPALFLNSSRPIQSSQQKPLKDMSHEKIPGWLGYIGDEILPSYIGIIINHEIRIPINQPV